MSLHEFVIKMQNAIQDYYGENVTVVVNSVTKNNGIILEGMSILEKERNISPTIYLNSFYEEYQSGVTFSECVQKLIQVYEKNRTTGDMNMDFFIKYENVRNKVVFKLINYKKNEALLKEIPHIRYLDLAIVFYCMVMNEMVGNATILIQHKHCQMWGVGKEELYEDAKKNTPRILPFELQKMEDVIRKIMFDQIRNDCENEICCLPENIRGDEEAMEAWIKKRADEFINQSMEYKNVEMYVLSNCTRMLGAACILYENVMEQFAEMVGRDYYVLPSSIHELILVPVVENGDRSDLNDMVREVNQTQLDAEEVLADHAYYYSRLSGKLSVV